MCCVCSPTPLSIYLGGAVEEKLKAQVGMCVMSWSVLGKVLHVLGLGCFEIYLSVMISNYRHMEGDRKSQQWALLSPL